MFIINLNRFNGNNGIEVAMDCFLGLHSTKNWVMPDIMNISDRIKVKELQMKPIDCNFEQ